MKDKQQMMFISQRQSVVQKVNMNVESCQTLAGAATAITTGSRTKSKLPQETKSHDGCLNLQVFDFKVEDQNKTSFQ